MSADTHLLRHIREAREAIVAAARLIRIYVSEERCGVTRAMARKASRNADARVRVAIYCSAECTISGSSWARADYERIHVVLYEVESLFACGAEQIERTRFRRSRREASACAALCAAIEAVLHVEREARAAIARERRTAAERFAELSARKEAARVGQEVPS